MRVIPWLVVTIMILIIACLCLFCHLEGSKTEAAKLKGERNTFQAQNAELTKKLKSYQDASAWIEKDRQNFTLGKDVGILDAAQALSKPARNADITELIFDYATLIRNRHGMVDESQSPDYLAPEKYCDRTFTRKVGILNLRGGMAMSYDHVVLHRYRKWDNKWAIVVEFRESAQR